MLPPGLETPREVTLYYDSVYESRIASGKARPFLYPWAGIGAFVILGYLLIDHRKSTTWRNLRYPLFAFLFAFQSWCILTTRAKHPAGAFGVGLLSAWGLLWVASIMIVNDCQSDFFRIERYERDGGNNVVPTVDKPSTNGAVAASEKHLDGSLNLSGTKSTPQAPNSTRLDWQEYPSILRNRLDWVADVFCNFRGVGWNWQTSGIPPPPKSIATQMRGNVDSDRAEEVTVSRSGIRRFRDKSKLLKAAAIKIAFGYLALDVIKVLMNNDPYFSGYVDAAPPSYLLEAVRTSHLAVRYYRLLIGLAGVYIALTQAFNLGPLFFCGLLGPDLIGVRGEPWMNPADMFGSFRGVLDHGLGGWWGSWWHQTFRFAFETTADKLLDSLNIHKKSNTGRMISLFVAFFLSGCLHAAGSYTQLGDTRPLMGPMRFFLLQPFGIILQLILSRQMARIGLRQRMPKLVRQAGNFAYVHVWGYFTAPLLIDDFAKGGNFLFEPIAFSPLRAMGLGAKDDTWYCWWNGLLFWRSGKTWWDTGIGV